MTAARSCLILAVCYLLMPGRVGHCQGVPLPGGVYRGPEFAAKLHEFDRKYQVTSRGANDSGFINRAVGAFSEPLNGRDPFEVALEFFEENKDVFGMRDPRSELAIWEGGKPDKRTGVIHARFQQVLKGVPAGGSVGAHYGRDGVLKDFEIRYRLGINATMDTKPTLAVEHALDAIGKSRQTTAEPRVRKHELVIYNGQRLAWFLETSWGEYYIDATDGTVLHWWSGEYDSQPTTDSSPPPAGSPEFHDTSRQRH